MVWRVSGYRWLLLAAALLVPVAGARAQEEEPHSAPPGPIEAIALRDLPQEQRLHARELFGQFVCACPKENWSRVLASCPDGCADRQKTEIMYQVRDGWPDEKILEFQVANYGSKVLASPQTAFGVWVYVLPFVVLLGGAAAVVTYLSSAQAAPRPANETEASAGEVAAIEKELEEVE